MISFCEEAIKTLLRKGTG